METRLIERLRYSLDYDLGPDDVEALTEEAATEITRLRAVVADFEQTPGWREYRDENKRLTAERDMLVQALHDVKNSVFEDSGAFDIAKTALAKVKKP
jgi:hypothetical protein